MHSDDLPNSESFHFRLMFFLNGYIDRIVPGGTDGEVLILDHNRTPLGDVDIFGHNAFTVYKILRHKDGSRPSEERITKFEREAREWFLIARHPLLFAPIGVKIFEEIPLIQMPYVEQNLREYLDVNAVQNSGLPLTAALVITSEILKGLSVAQAYGLAAHQDLKLENVFVDKLHLRYPVIKDPIDECFLHMARIGDFGLANMWAESGTNSNGTRPYMAPEQYSPDKFESFEPDVFATGVILTMLLTNMHPSGRPKEFRSWRRARWESWANDSERGSLEDLEIPDARLTALIKKMLEPNPNERIGVEAALNEVLNILTSIDHHSAQNLGALLELWDFEAEFYGDEKELMALMNVADVPIQIPFVKSKLLSMLAAKLPEIKSARDAFAYCALSIRTAWFLAKSEGLKKAEIDFLHFIQDALQVSSEWRDEWKPEHQYPVFEINGVKIGKPPDLGNWEIYINIIGRLEGALSESLSDTEVSSIFLDHDTEAYAAYLACCGIDLATKMAMATMDDRNHPLSDGTRRLDNLYHRLMEIADQCVIEAPNKAALYWYRGNWKKEFLQCDQRGAGLIDAEPSKELLLSALSDYERAVELEPSWLGARRSLEDILATLDES